MTSQRDVCRGRTPLAESHNDSRGGSIEARTAPNCRSGRNGKGRAPWLDAVIDDETGTGAFIGGLAQFGVVH